MGVVWNYIGDYPVKSDDSMEDVLAWVPMIPNRKYAFVNLAYDVEGIERSLVDPVLIVFNQDGSLRNTVTVDRT